MFDYATTLCLYLITIYALLSGLKIFFDSNAIYFCSENIMCFFMRQKIVGLSLYNWVLYKAKQRLTALYLQWQPFAWTRRYYWTTRPNGHRWSLVLMVVSVRTSVHAYKSKCVHAYKTNYRKLCAAFDLLAQKSVISYMTSNLSFK